MPKRTRDKKITEECAKDMLTRFMLDAENKATNLKEAYRDEWVLFSGKWGLCWLTFLGTALHYEKKYKLSKECLSLLLYTLQELCGLTKRQAQNLFDAVCDEIKEKREDKNESRSEDN